MTSAPAEPSAKPNRREVFAWAMYDWANSAYSTLSITMLVYYIKEVVVPGRLGTVVWAWGISLSMLTAAVLSPILGALADANAGKRRWLAATALSGAGCAVLMALVPPQSTWMVLSWFEFKSAWLVVSLFVITCLMFELSLGFYNGFLPEIAEEKDLNRVSAWGYALGYLGGALALLLALGVKIAGESLGLPEVADQLRAGIFIMGIWWGLFTLPTVWILRDRGIAPEERLPPLKAVSHAIGEVGHTLRNIRLYKTLSLFLLAFLFYNDGIQSVISQSSTFAIDVLSFSVVELTILILVIQLVALPGALLVGRLADRFGQKPTLVGCLAVWIGLIVAAYHITTKPQFWVLGIVLAFVMGGTQSISRAIMGLMTPVSHSAEFFGFFNFSGKATSFLGTFLFGLIIAHTGNPRLAILSLLVFFIIGWAIVASINIQKGRREALESG